MTTTKLVVTAVVILTSFVAYSLYSRRSQAKSKRPSSSSPSPNAPFNHTDKKHERYLKLIPKLIMKKTMYDNVRMYNPNGACMCTISAKKARWYLKKGLAVEHNVEGKEGVKLKFAPNKSSEAKTVAEKVYEAREKSNTCVVCASSSQGYMKHYVRFCSSD